MKILIIDDRFMRNFFISKYNRPPIWFSSHWILIDDLIKYAKAQGNIRDLPKDKLYGNKIRNNPHENTS